MVLDPEDRPLVPASSDPGTVRRWSPITVEGERAHDGRRAVDVFRGAVRRRWWQVLLVALPVILLAATYTYLAPRLYEAESTFLLEATGRDVGGGASLDLLDRIGRVGRLENEIALLQSRRVLIPTVDRLNLHATLLLAGEEVRPEALLAGFDAGREAEPNLYLAIPSGDSTTLVESATGQEVTIWATGDTVGLPGIRFVAPDSAVGFELRIDEFAAAVAGLARATDVSRVGREADLVRLTCTTEDPEAARDICVALSLSYLDLRSELKVAEAANAREFLADAAGRIKDQLTEAENGLAEYSRRNAAVALDTKAHEEVRNVAGLAAQRDAKIAERMALRQFLASIGAGDAGTGRYRELASFPTFLNNDAITELVASLIALDNRRSDLAMLRSEANPEMLALSQRIAEIERQLQSMAVAYEGALTFQIESLSETAAAANQRVAGIPTRQIELARHERQVEQLQSMYTALQGRLREAELAEGVGMPNVRPIDTPEVPLGPASPAVPLNLAIGTSLGLALGVLLAAYREMTDVRVRTRYQVEADVGLEVIGMLPAVSEPAPLFADGASSRFLGLLQRGGRKEGHANGESEVVWQPSVESFRTLAADLRIALGAVNGSRPIKTIAVMSSAQGEGKTYAACNLALVWASMGPKTLLIDADLRVGRVTRFLGLPPDAPGLCDVLRGDVHPSAVYRSVRVRGGSELKVLTAGRVSGDDVSTFHVPGRIGDLFEYCQRDFDVVLVDTPPLNVVSETSIIATSVDAVLLVVRSGLTRPDALDLALQRLQRANSRVLGVVMNDVTLPSYYASYYGSHRPG